MSDIDITVGNTRILVYPKFDETHARKFHGLGMVFDLSELADAVARVMRATGVSDEYAEQARSGIATYDPRPDPSRR